MAMSSTMVMTTTPPNLAHTQFPNSSPCCPGCGFGLDDTHSELVAAQARIAELETQVRMLNEKATAAVDRWADYEDELTKLRAQLPPPEAQKQQQPTTPTNPRMSLLQSGTSRLSALLSPRKSTPELRDLETPPRPHNQRSASSPNHNQPPPSPSAEDLMEALTREQSLRKEAEGRVAATGREVEELSAALFEQANEMVAEERRARAKLEQRVDELERRDVDKRRRLERLEGAMARIERVRALLAEEEDVRAPVVVKEEDVVHEMKKRTTSGRTRSESNIGDHLTPAIFKDDNRRRSTGVDITRNQNDLLPHDG